MKQLFDQLRAEAERQPLPEPAILRVRGDRRTTRRRATGVMAVVLLMAGGAYATRPQAPDEFPGTFPSTIAESPTPSPTPSPAPPVDSNCKDTYPRQLPEAVFPPGGSEICFEPVERFHFEESVPAPCQPAAIATDPLIEDRRGFSFVVDEPMPSGPPAPTALHQTITRYRGGGAAQFLADLAHGVDACAPIVLDDLRITYRREHADATSLRLRVEYALLRRPEVGPQQSTYLVVITHVGNHVAVVYDKGWEGIPSQDKTVMDAATKLTEALGSM